MEMEFRPILFQRVPREVAAAHMRAVDCVDQLRALAGAQFMDQFDGEELLVQRGREGMSSQASQHELSQNPGFGGDYVAETRIAQTQRALQQAMLAGADVFHLDHEAAELEILIREKEVAKKLDRLTRLLSDKKPFSHTEFALIRGAIARAGEAGVDVKLFEERINVLERSQQKEES